MIYNKYFAALFYGKVLKTLTGAGLGGRFCDSSTDLSTEIVNNRKITDK
jgi:hypothetical protein